MGVMLLQSLYCKRRYPRRPVDAKPLQPLAPMIFLLVADCRGPDHTLKESREEEELHHGSALPSQQWPTMHDARCWNMVDVCDGHAANNTCIRTGLFTIDCSTKRLPRRGCAVSRRSFSACSFGVQPRSSAAAPGIGSS
ncbi:hypothetical protein CORC01_06250 [Colletotrichum orchidophilum]|uniref:Uncharacterized protein n=1 Tax=Colletotrichum orchidophilum TaxID=1209926 RepID=A0A1G4BAL6_9PEZI|nr:uncharacterized protein CORC01_06250 [Colletotrichum orchidophilum]OHE98459.1 hypothetical protein CORC01_06250 [Colletotrichum orchidophilum]